MDIPAGDRVTYAEAVAITGRSRRYLAQLAQQGRLSRTGGTPRTALATWLSRAECEELALQQYRRGRASDYWLTIAAPRWATGFFVARTSDNQVEPRSSRVRLYLVKKVEPDPS